MSDVFENLKKHILSYFRKNKNSKQNKDTPKPSETKEKIEQGDESSVCLLDESERRNMYKFKYQNEDKKFNTIPVIQTYRIPIVYLILSLCTLIFMFIIGNKSNKDLYLEIGIGNNKISILNFFRMSNINPLAFHILNSCTAIVGFGIIYTVYLVLISKFKQKKYNNFDFVKLYLSMIFGAVSMLFHIIYGTCYLVTGYNEINQMFNKELHVGLKEFIFFVEIFFTVLYGIFTMLIIYNLKEKPSTASFENNDSTTHAQYTWVNYKLLTLIYIIFFSLAYIFINLHHNGVIFKGLDSEILKSNYSYLLCLFPYLIYILNSLFYFYFYDELRNSEITVTDPIDSKMNYCYDNYQKNIL